MGRTQLVALSLGAHVLLGFGLGTIPPKRHHEVIAITMTDVKQRAPPPHVDPPPPAPESQALPRPLRAKSAPVPAKAAPIAPVTHAQASSLDALPDFGVALSGGPGGLAIPGGGGKALAPASAAGAKVLSRAPASKADDCGDPPAKPKLSSRPNPTYTEAARAAGISGKVRVEITVDEQGRVVGVRVLQGLGYGLDDSAVAAARALTFEPAVRCGKPSAATFKIGFNFAP